MQKTIILIGPVGSGKSTIGKLLSNQLNIPQASLDDVRWDIYKELGYDFEYADKLFTEQGFLGIYKYWKPFEAKSVQIVLERYIDHIHDFGAGQSVYEDDKLFSEVKNVLNNYDNVVLLLPAPDKNESLRVLNKRTDFPHNDLFINNPSNVKLAKHIVYTDGKTPEETCSEIIDLLKV